MKDLQDLKDLTIHQDGERSFPLCSPEGVCCDAEGSIFVVDTIQSCICRVDPAGKVPPLSHTMYL